MFYKIFTTLSFVFLLTVAIIFGNYLYELSGLIGVKNRDDFLDTGTTPIVNVPDSRVREVVVRGNSVSVELAQTVEERAKGLMERSSLAYNSGMLFIFPRAGVYSFWMKNTRIPLDITWIDKDKRIVYIEHNVQPCLELVCPKYRPTGEASYVLETNAGWMKKAEVEAGDFVEFR